MSVALSMSRNGVTHFLDIPASNSSVIWMFSSKDLTVNEGPILVNRVVTWSLEEHQTASQNFERKMGNSPRNFSELGEQMPAHSPLRREHSALFNLEARYKALEPRVAAGQVVQLSSFVVGSEDTTVLLHLQRNEAVDDMVSHVDPKDVDNRTGFSYKSGFNLVVRVLNEAGASQAAGRHKAMWHSQVVEILLELVPQLPLHVVNALPQFGDTRYSGIALEGGGYLLDRLRTMR